MWQKRFDVVVGQGHTIGELKKYFIGREFRILIKFNRIRLDKQFDAIVDETSAARKTT